MNWKTWLPLALALVFGLIAAVVGKDMLAKMRGLQAATPMASMVVATHELAAGQALTAEDLTLAKVSPDSVPEGSVSEKSSLLGRVIDTRLVKGQAILESALTPVGTTPGLAALVPEGMRAITVEVNEYTGVAGHLVPGSLVDVLASVQDPENRSFVTRTIAQLVPVRAVGRAVAEKAEGKTEAGQTVKSVTLIVTPQQAELIQLAATSAKSWLVMRGSRDQKIIETTGVSLVDLRGETPHAPVPTQVAAVSVPVAPVEVQPQPAKTDPQPQQAEPKPAPKSKPKPKPSVRVIRGGKESIETVEGESAPAETIVESNEKDAVSSVQTDEK